MKIITAMFNQNPGDVVTGWISGMAGGLAYVATEIKPMLFNVSSIHDATITLLWAVVTAFATGIAGVAGKHAFTWGFARAKLIITKRKSHATKTNRPNRRRTG